MTAAMGTLVFLATLWLLVVVGAGVLEESGAKIVAALKGRQIALTPIGSVPARARSRAPFAKLKRSPATWRAAA
jgi:hypothetical protein